MPVFGPTGWVSHVKPFLSTGESEPIDGTFEVHDLHDGERVELGPLRLEAVATVHSVETYAVRVTSGASTLAYSADSGSCDALGRLADQADLFVCEAAWAEWPEGVPPIHLTPQLAGEWAAKARARRLLLTHLRPGSDPAAAAARRRGLRRPGGRRHRTGGAPHLMGRKDGRTPDQLRPVTITLGWQETAFASALVELGRTKVVCAVSYEDRVPPFLRGSGKGWVTSEYAMLPGATGERSGREVSKGRPGGRTHEIQRLIGRSLRAVTDTKAFGESTLWVDCDVLQADGGTRCASITGAWVALFAACHRLQQEKRVKSFPLRDHVAAVSVGMVDGTPASTSTTRRTSAPRPT